MIAKWIRHRYFVLLITALSTQMLHAQGDFDQKHLEVSLRMIGHRILLNAADSVSRVLPIIETNGQYRIEFESEFGFQPDDLVKAVSDVMKENEAAIRYIVEVEECETEQVVYSFEIDNEKHEDIIPCNTRGQSANCFSLVFTVLESPPAIVQKSDNQESNQSSVPFLPLGIGVTFLVGIVIYFYARKTSPPSKNDLIKLGQFVFDYRNATLHIGEQQTELTSKEADLLKLLHSSLNNPVKREMLLAEIWEDEGNYVGRTLDVFISKLRAKLQADENVKIMNIRGVGYKLVVND